MADQLEPAELARALTGLARWAEEHTEAKENVVRSRLAEHLGDDPSGLPVVTEELGVYERVNAQVALDAWLAQPGRDADVIGLNAPHYELNLAHLAAESSPFGFTPEPSPVQHVTVRVGPDVVECLESALVLLRSEDGPLALFVMTGEHGFSSRLALEVMAGDRAVASAFLDELRRLRHEHNVYRGRIVEFGSTEDGQAVTVRDVPLVDRDRIVLPEDAFASIERHTLGVAEHAQALVAAGRHLKRGLLLHGPPGTGKTLTAMHLAKRMPERTTVLLTGHSFGAIDPGVDLARALQPAMVIMEDVDLVAEDRDLDPDSNPLLYELLNAMEGLQEDADVIFLLTTNRPDVLERALVQRPGRIDLAVELPLPDAEGRRRLLALYADGLEIDAGALGEMVERTEGVSPAFIRELLRRGALMAAVEGDARRVGAQHLHAAMDELEATRLTSRLLGGARDDADATDDSDF